MGEPLARFISEQFMNWMLSAWSATKRRVASASASSSKGVPNIK